MNRLVTYMTNMKAIVPIKKDKSQAKGIKLMKDVSYHAHSFKLLGYTWGYPEYLRGYKGRVQSS
jgi:hypothetical protein